MNARDVMSDGVVSIASDASVLEAARLLVNCRLCTIPVVDRNGLMVGMVSEADLMGNVADLGDGAAQRKVIEVMDRGGLTASEDSDLVEIARLMTGRGIKRVPILRNGVVVGMVSRVDILRGLISVDRAGQSRSSTATVLDDEQLRREVRAACQGRVWSIARQMDVVARGGVVHLWGIVPSDLVRQAYRVAAERVSGVKSVEVHMHIVPPPATRIGL